jgi:(p)ppGpp synthase/HD superfamily hydrolase
MKYTHRIEKALKKAAYLHRDQIRKSMETMPYITHPFAVAIILSNYTDDEDIIIAGLLHDTIEDADYTPAELEKDFGKRVREIVMGVTETKDDDEGKELPWKVRKEAYIAGLASDSRESLLLCAADKIHNMRNQLDDFDKDGDASFSMFNSTPEERMWYHRAVLDVLRSKLDSPILVEYQRLLKESSRIG